MNKAVSIAYIDYLVAFAVTFIMMYAPVHSKNEAKLDAKAEFVITMDWGDASPNDVDLWVEDPEGHIVSFRTKSSGTMTLDRDDLGTGGASDPIRREVVTIRGKLQGRYTVNAMMYSLRGAPTPVKVSIMKMNPFKSVADKQFTLTTQGEEITAASFDVDNDGNIINVDKDTQTRLAVKQ